MYYLKALRFKVSCSTADPKPEYLFIFFPIETLQAKDATKLSLTLNMLSAFDRDSLTHSLHFQSNLIILSDLMIQYIFRNLFIK